MFISSDSASPVAEDDPELLRYLRGEPVRMVAVQVVTATVAASLLAVAMSIYLSNVAGIPHVIPWLAAKIAIVVPRILLGLKAHTLTQDAEEAVLRRYKWKMRALMLADGLIWGAAGVVLMPEQNHVAVAVVISSLIGVATVATFTLHPDRWSVFLFSIPIILPAALNFIFRDAAEYHYYGFGALVLLGGLLALSVRAQRQVEELLRLRFITDRFAEIASKQSAAKSSFLAMITHELRTPLHGMLGLSRLAVENTHEPLVKSHLQKAMRSGEHLLSVINDVLEFSKIEAGRVVLSPRPFDLAEVIQDISDIATVNAQSKQIAFVLDSNLNSSCPVIGDASRVRQLLHNVVGNAIKFTSAGRVVLRVNIEPSSSSQSVRCSIEVEDTGPGIPAEHIPNLFESFYRLENSVNVQGSGLGLAISKRIADSMGANLTVVSTVGKGSMFQLNIEFPVPPADALAKSSYRFLGAVDLHGAASQTGKLTGHVLLAEDNEVNALIAVTALEQMGLEVETVADGQAAVERALADNRPDLILMDCLMPTLDGYEATRMIRQVESKTGMHHIPIVALTANATTGDDAACTSAGMDGYLSKPFNSAQLLSAIAPFLHHPGGSTPSS